MEGVFDAVAIRVVLEARRWQGESEESYSQRSEDLCYQVTHGLPFLPIRVYFDELVRSKFRLGNC